MIDEKDYKPFQRRVAEEKNDLDEKLVALKSFLNSPISEHLDVDERLRMTDQMLVMTRYSDILKDRIENFK